MYTYLYYTGFRSGGPRSATLDADTLEEAYEAAMEGVHRHHPLAILVRDRVVATRMDILEAEHQRLMNATGNKDMEESGTP